MTQYQGTMEWSPHMDPTSLYLGVVSLLCSVSVLIISLHLIIQTVDKIWTYIIIHNPTFLRDKIMIRIKVG
jgi:hypothetical protein